jgi:hypothetical protein
LYTQSQDVLEGGGKGCEGEYVAVLVSSEWKKRGRAAQQAGDLFGFSVFFCLFFFFFF